MTKFKVGDKVRIKEFKDKDHEECFFKTLGDDIYSDQFKNGIGVINEMDCCRWLNTLVFFHGIGTFWVPRKYLEKVEDEPEKKSPKFKEGDRVICGMRKGTLKDYGYRDVIRTVHFDGDTYDQPCRVSEIKKLKKKIKEFKVGDRAIAIKDEGRLRGTIIKHINTDDLLIRYDEGGWDYLKKLKKVNRLVNKKKEFKGEDRIVIKRAGVLYNLKGTLRSTESGLSIDLDKPSPRNILGDSYMYLGRDKFYELYEDNSIKLLVKKKKISRFTEKTKFIDGAEFKIPTFDIPDNLDISINGKKLYRAEEPCPEDKNEKTKIEPIKTIKKVIGDTTITITGLDNSEIGIDSEGVVFISTESGVEVKDENPKVDWTKPVRSKDTSQGTVKVISTNMIEERYPVLVLFTKEDGKNTYKEYTLDGKPRRYLDCEERYIINIPESELPKEEKKFDPHKPSINGRGNICLLVTDDKSEIPFLFLEIGKDKCEPMMMAWYREDGKQIGIEHLDSQDHIKNFTPDKGYYNIYYERYYKHGISVG